MIIHNDVKAFLNLTPSRFCFLEEIIFKRGFSNAGYDKNLSNGNEIIMTLREFTDNEARDLKLKFVNVLDVKIGNINNPFCVLLDIQDIRRDQQEGITYRVSEEEDNVFLFYCSDFFIEL